MAASSTSGQGRPKGVPNHATRDIKALAQSYGPAAILSLAKLAGMIPGEDGAVSEPARISAIKELMDRGYGKAVQPQSGPDGESNPVVEIRYTWGDAPEPE